MEIAQQMFIGLSFSTCTGAGLVHLAWVKNHGSKEFSELVKALWAVCRMAHLSVSIFPNMGFSVRSDVVLLIQ